MTVEAEIVITPLRGNKKRQQYCLKGVRWYFEEIPEFFHWLQHKMKLIGKMLI